MKPMETQSTQKRMYICASKIENNYGITVWYCRIAQCREINLI
jgi:hypothetical protein